MIEKNRDKNISAAVMVLSGIKLNRGPEAQNH
jgi:hypothetical protein